MAWAYLQSLGYYLLCTEVASKIVVILTPLYLHKSKPITDHDNGGYITESPFQLPSISYVIVQHLPKSFATGEWQEGITTEISDGALGLLAPFNYGETYLPLYYCI